jgi:hypothetical protein
LDVVQRNVQSQAHVSIEDVHCVSESLSLASDLSQHFHHPVDDHGSFFPIQMQLVVQVSVQVFTLDELFILEFYPSQRVVLKVNVDLIDFSLKLSNLLFWGLFGRPENSRGRHDPWRFMKPFPALA